MARKRYQLPAVPTNSQASIFAPLLRGQIVKSQAVRIRTAQLFSCVFQRLNLRGIIDTHCGDDGDAPAGLVIEAMIHSRLESEAPVPLSRIEAWLSRSIVPHLLGISADKLNEYRVGRVLEKVGPDYKSLWMSILANAHAEYGLKLDRIVYDTTSFYFEGEYEESDIVRFGKSRDDKPSCKQINVGVNVSQPDGIPIDYTLMAGNTADVKTVHSNIDQLKKIAVNLNLQPNETVVVGDRAMLTPALMWAYKDAGLHFVGTMNGSKLQERLIRSVPDEMLEAFPLKYVAARFQRPAHIENIEERYFTVRTTLQIGPDKSHIGHEPFLCQALVVMASGKRRLDAQLRETLLKRTENRLAEIAAHLNKGRYKSRAYADDQMSKALARFPSTKQLLDVELGGEDGNLTLSVSRNHEAIAHATFMDGKYVVFFDQVSLSDDDAFDIFKGRDIVERRIGDLKSPIEVRPVYLHKDKRIAGLVFCCMVALLAVALVERELLEHQIPLTFKELGHTFFDYAATVVVFRDQSQLVTFPVADKWQEQVELVLGALKSPFTSALLATNAPSFEAAVAPYAQPWPAPKPRKRPG